jgi:2-amino-4-hydroxy-6-hydroxymethyldihydropteridine diphosphokinase
MPEAFVGLGSNADPVAALRAAVAALAPLGGELRSSSVYRSAAVGVAAADYLNMVVSFESDLGAAVLRAELALLETALGRSRADPAVCRIDLDLLFYGAAVAAGQGLPRPGAFAAAFVVTPLAELAPELRHPLTGVRCVQAWEELAARAPQLTNLGDLGALR